FNRVSMGSPIFLTGPHATPEPPHQHQRTSCHHHYDARRWVGASKRPRLDRPAQSRYGRGAMRETVYRSYTYQPPQLPHRYGANVHLLGDQVMLTQLARLSRPETL